MMMQLGQRAAPLKREAWRRNVRKARRKGGLLHVTGDLLRELTVSYASIPAFVVVAAAAGAGGVALGAGSVVFALTLVADATDADAQAAAATGTIGTATATFF